MTTKLLGVREFRKNMANLYKEAREKNLRYIVLSRNKPIFKIEPLDEKNAIIEKLAFDIEEARAEVKKGKIESAEKVFSDLGL